MSLPVALLVLAGLGVERYLLRDRVRFSSAVRAITTATIPLGTWRAPAGALAWAYAGITVILPLIGLFVLPGGGATFTPSLPRPRTTPAPSLSLSAPPPPPLSLPV